MLPTLFLVCFVALVAATVLLLALGDRVRVASRVLGLAAGVVLAVGAGEAAAAGVRQLAVAVVDGGAGLRSGAGLAGPTTSTTG